MNLGRVLIVGAGIGGLTAARALRRHAQRIVVVERAPAFGAVGAGIVLAANAVHALRQLEIDVVPHGREIDGLDLRSASGTLLSSVRLRDVSPDVPGVGVHRAALHELLLASVHHDADLRPGRTWTHVAESGDGVDVTFDDGTSERFDLVLGADGLHSPLRAHLGGPAPEYSGYTCWRAVVDEVGRARAIEWWGRGRRFGAVPLAGDRTYLFLTRNAPAGGSAHVEDFERMFADFEPEVRGLAGKIDASLALHHDLSALSTAFWGRGRVWLLGDAAHATLPNEGQGAAMAIEDGVALRAALAAEGSLDAALARWVRARDARVRKIQRDSRWLGWVGQWENPLLTALRNAVVRATPARVARRQLADVVGPGMIAW